MSSSATQSSAVPSFTNENRGTSVLAVFWVETGIAIGFVGGRFYGRRLIGAVGLDDWSMLITLVSSFRYAFPSTWQANMGFISCSLLLQAPWLPAPQILEAIDI